MNNIEKINNIKYGWVDKDHNIHIDDYDTFSDDYRLQSPEEVLESKVGVCWDQVELERELFKDYENVKTYFIVHYDDAKCPTHTFLTYTKDGKVYWFEHAWEMYRGVHEYASIRELLKDVRSKFIDCEIHGDYQKDKLVIHEYSKPKYGIGVIDFFTHCDSGPFINLDE